MIKKFSIEIISSRSKKIKGALRSEGRIMIDDYEENFLMSLDEWGEQEYKKQWREGLERIKTHTVSCLITSITTLQVNPRIRFWALYKIDDEIFFQPHILGGVIMEERKVGLPPYNAQTCYLYVHPRRIYNSMNQKLDEWSIRYSDFLQAIE